MDSEWKKKLNYKQWNHFYFYPGSVSEFLRTVFASQLKTSDSFYPQFLLESIHISLELKEFQAMMYLDFESHQFDLSELCFSLSLPPSTWCQFQAVTRVEIGKTCILGLRLDCDF